MGERLDLQVARAWLLLGGYENDRSDAIAANAQYDRAGLFVRGPDGPGGALEHATPPPTRAQEPHAGLPPSRVPGYSEVVNRGMASPGSWVFLADVNRHGDTAPVMRFVYWDDETDTWRRFAACPDLFSRFTVRQPWRSLAACGPSQGAGPGPSTAPGACAGGGCGYAPNLECLRAVGRRSSDYVRYAPQDPPSATVRLASEAMEANTLSFYRTSGRAPPEWDFLSTAARFVEAADTALATDGAREAASGATRPTLSSWGSITSSSGAGPSVASGPRPEPRAAATVDPPDASPSTHNWRRACHPECKVVLTDESSDRWDSSEEDSADDGPCWITTKHIEAISEGLAVLEARADPAAPSRRSVPLEWGTRTTVLGLVDLNPGGSQPWTAECVGAMAYEAQEVWVRQPGAPFTSCGPHSTMASGVPLPVMAKMVKSRLACRNGFGSADDDVRMEEPGAERPPADEEVIRFTGHNEEEHAASRQR